MNYYTIKYGPTDQALIIDKLRNAGFELIQVSNGLVTKAQADLSELRKTLREISELATVEALDPKDPTLSKDARKFVGIE